MLIFPRLLRACTPSAGHLASSIAVPQLLDFPVLTPRLRLRPLELADTEALYAYRSLPDVCRYVPFTPMAREDIAERISGIWSGRTLEDEGDAMTLGVELSGSEQLIGDIVLFLRSKEHRGGEVGWIFNPDHSGHGYATEAARALLDLAFGTFGLHRVITRVDARNTASLRLCERLDMRREAHLVSNEWFKGEWSDEVDFAVLDREWNAPTSQA